MGKRNVLITGLPRSGTTLTCHLLNKLPNTVALHEPMQVTTFPEYENSAAVCDEIDSFFQEMRRSILTNKTAISMQVAGKVPDNPVANKYSDSGLRQSIVARTEIVINKDLDPDFLLAVKHPGAFTALLDSLVERFPVYATIRNPLSVLSSWNSVALPVQRGHVPAAENLDHRLKQMLLQIQDKYERQLYILSWFFEKYDRLLPKESVLRYEDTISTGGAALKAITPRAALLTEKLQSKNKNEMYKSDVMKFLGDKLLNSEGAYWKFYSKEQVEELVA